MISQAMTGERRTYDDAPYHVRETTLSRFFCGIIFIYLALSCFYLFPSGNPQIRDFVLAPGITAAFIAFLARKGFRVDSIHLLALMFGAYTFLINMIYFMFLQDAGLLLSSLYYVYNASIFIFIATAFRSAPSSAWVAVYSGIAASIVLQVIYVQINPVYESGRIIGSFNNPNQLADWSLFSACALVMLKSRSRLNLMDMLLLAAVGYLQTAALSKAGIICYLILVGALPFTRLGSGSFRFLFMLGGLAALLIAFAGFSSLYQDVSSVTQVERTVHRLQNIGKENDDSARGRGYERLLRYPEYLPVGAGEGAYYRFSDFTKPIEIHSGLANILFSYGVLGLGLFLVLIVAIARKTPRIFLLPAFVVLLNGLTHQNVRFSHLWVFLGAAYGMQQFSSRPLYDEEEDAARA